MFLDLVRRYQERYGVKLFAYCLQAGELHLLLEIETPGSISRGEGRPAKTPDMQGVNAQYARYYGSRYRRRGDAAGTRARKMTAYISANPVSRTLLKRCAADTSQAYLYAERCPRSELDSLRRAVCEAFALVGGEEAAGSISRTGGRRKGERQGREEFIARVRAEVEAYKAKGLAEKSESIWGGNYRLYLLIGGLFLVLVVSASGIFLFFFKKEN